MDGLNPVFQIDKLMRYKKVIDEQIRGILWDGKIEWQAYREERPI